MTRTLVLLLLIATYLVFGGGAVEASDPRAKQLTYESWSKVCIDGSHCIVGAGARGACYPSGGILYIAMPDGKSANLFAGLGTRALEGGISVRIDQGDPILIPHLECFANGCGGRVEIDSAIIESLKRSQTVTIEATTTAHRKLRLSLPLAGFAKAYDGPGTEPKAFETSQDQLKELLRQQGEKDQPPPQCED